MRKNCIDLVLAQLAQIAAAAARIDRLMPEVAQLSARVCGLEGQTSTRTQKPLIIPACHHRRWSVLVRIIGRRDRGDIALVERRHLQQSIGEILDLPRKQATDPIQPRRLDQALRDDPMRDQHLNRLGQISADDGGTVPHHVHGRSLTVPQPGSLHQGVR